MDALTINGAVLHYRANLQLRGTKTFVFINSLGTDMRIWDGVASRLTGQFNFVLHDKRGHGLSDLGKLPLRIADYAEDLKQLLVKLEVRDVILCGLSVGGLVAQFLMQERLPGLRGAVLSNTGLGIGTEQTWNERISAVSSGGMAAITDGVIERWFSPTYRIQQQQQVTLYRNMLLRCPQDGYTACCAAIRDARFDHSTRARIVPALCVGSETDGATPPPLVQALSANIAGASYVEIKGAGHLPCIEQSDYFAKIISDFAEKL
jgi:3-oxoadipate enol-lactonase